LTYGFSNHPRAVSALGTNSYTYDANGSMITRVIGGVTYTLTYDKEHRLTASYIYDGDGNRVRALVNGTWTNYLGNYYEATSASTTKYYYAGAQRVAREAPPLGGWRVNTSSPYYGFSDHLGSTSVIVSVAGEVIGSQLYKAWGTSRYTSGTLNTSFKYTGQREAENGLYFYNARWYDPILGRFAQADTIIPEPGNPLSWDRYAYAQNNPIKYTDQTGHRVSQCGQGGSECGGSSKPRYSKSTNNDESKPPVIAIIPTPSPTIKTSIPQRTFTPNPTSSNTPTPTTIARTTEKPWRTPTPPPHVTPTIEAQYPSRDWIMNLDREDLVWDAAGIVIDVFSEGIGGRVANVLQVVGKGVSVTSAMNIGGTGNSYNTNDGTDWYERVSTTLSVVGIGVPIIPDAANIVFNIAHAIQLANQY